MRTIQTYQKDIDNLCKRGLQLMAGLYNELQDECREVIEKLDPDTKSLVEKETFKDKYNSWYNESLSVIHQLIPERLNDFKSYYKIEKRKSIDYETYTISDYLIDLVTETGWGTIDLGRSAVISKFKQQLYIVVSLKDRFKSSLYEIKQLLQADLFDSEIEAARVLLKNGFLRASGAMCGVVLERHLSQVCQNHKISLKKKNPHISDYNEALKGGDVIDIPTWRLVLRLGDIRNICDHKKEREPREDEVEDLIDGVDKIIETLF